ncbi:MAG: SnoaL-like domain [Frankiales bacterium]|nr:SnoaL-like domain [Frankiales bacterium]
MSHEAVLREMYDALNRKDTEALASKVADDAVFHLLPNPVVDATTLTGSDEILGYLKSALADLDMQQQVESISESGDFATAYVTSRSADASGAVQVVRWADVFQFSGGMIIQHVSLAG